MLTDYDRAWLDALDQSIKSWTPFMLAEVYSSQAWLIRSLACEVLVYHNHIFVRAEQLVEAVVRDISPAQVNERYRYRCACAVHQFAATSDLSKTDARAFLYASGYHGSDLEAMRELAENAQESFDAVYGFLGIE